MDYFKFFGAYIGSKLREIFLFFLCSLYFVLAFLLFDLPMSVYAYAFFLCLCTGLIALFSDYGKVLEQKKALDCIKDISTDFLLNLPSGYYPTDRDYLEIIALIESNRKQSDELALQKYNDMVDYYTVWAHQIKTPIAAMRLRLQNEDSGPSRKLLNDLSRIERYVEMVLTFIRLNSDSSDYVFKEYELDDIVKSSVKKFSGEFIDKKLSLLFEPLDMRVLTDAKWLSFVVEQIISNSLKYTDSGFVKIYSEGGSTLCIKDSGIGISASDIPRIFENGYTGFNGRTEKRSTGIGLYLCKKICTKLGCGIYAESVVSQGTTIRIVFPEESIVSVKNVRK